MPETAAEAGARFAARALLIALQRARRLLRQHGPEHGLTATALRELTGRMRAVTAHAGELTIELRGGSARLGQRDLYQDDPGDDLLAGLSALGIGALRITAEADAAAVRTFVTHLADPASASGSPEDDLVARLRRAHLRGIELLPAASWLGALPGRHGPWNALPVAPEPPDWARHGLAAEAGRNLPAQAAAACLEDLQAGPAAPAAVSLAAVLRAMLDRGDAHGAAWLIGEIGRSPLPLPQRRDLLQTAHARLDDGWIAACVQGGPHQVQGLVGLALELGTAAVASCLCSAELLRLPDAARYLAPLLTALPEVTAIAIDEVDLPLLPDLLAAVTGSGTALPVPACLRRLDLARRLGAPAPLRERIAAALRAAPLDAEERAGLERRLDGDDRAAR